jgi:hypothetical protein
MIDNASSVGPSENKLCAEACSPFDAGCAPLNGAETRSHLRIRWDGKAWGFRGSDLFMYTFLGLSNLGTLLCMLLSQFSEKPRKRYMVQLRANNRIKCTRNASRHHPNISLNELFRNMMDRCRRWHWSTANKVNQLKAIPQRCRQNLPHCCAHIQPYHSGHNLR